MQPLNEPKFPRLSRPVPLMRPEYDVVVVGSGYGAGVAASRMARAGKSVAILELGRERWPGEYPSDLKSVAPELHVSGHGKFSGMGKPTGLYHLIVGEGQNALVGNGLGGTSLINANIFLEADKRTLQLSNWPAEIRQDPAGLQPYYARAAHMLQPTAYPSHLPTPNKLDVLEKQAALLGFQRNFYRPPQTTFFHNGLNNAGVEMHASTGSGQDCTGVNDGSKNSVLVSYVADAWNRGAEIFCECEVRYVQKDADGSGYTVFFAWHEEGRGAFKEDFHNSLMWVRARELCFLGAGSLGTTEILLRSKTRGLRMSRSVGHKISGNGDMLAFGYDTNSIVNGIGTEGPRDGGACGPCITGIIDNRGPDVAPNVLDGYVIQEGAVPQALAPLLQTLLEGLSIPRSLSSLQSRVVGPYAKSGSVQRTQTYLVMTHDNGEGLVTMDGDKPRLQLLNVGRKEHVAKLTEVLENATRLIGGKLIASPFYNASSEREGITVHPLGGAVMSSDGSGRNGGTNHLGQLFTGQGEEVHEGLICVDASVIPTSLGVNPFATITALAERSVHYIAEQRGLTIDWSKNGRLDLFGQPAKVFSGKDDSTVVPDEEGADGEGDLRFTEIMEGHIHIGSDIDDFGLAESAGKGSASAMKLYLSVEGPNVEESECPPVQCFAEELEDGWTAIEDDFSVAMDSVSPKEEWTVIDNVDHECSASGTVSCGALSRHPLLVLRGKVRFFSVDEEVAHGTNLVYELTLLSTAGETYLLKGRKNVDSNMAFSVAGVWKATTTLDTTLFKSDGCTVVGRGRVHVSLSNFMSQMTTLRTGGIVPAFNFLSFFTRNLASFFFAPLSRLQYPDPRLTGYKFKVPPIESITLIARDGVRTPMKVWVPPESCLQRREFPLLLVPGASVDESIYALPTAEQNVVEYFTERGYTVYVPTMRWGRTPAAMKGDTPFDARLDVEAAMRYVREHQPGKKILIICHCVGAIATSCGLLDGSIPGEWIQGVLASQIFFKQHFGRVNRLKGHTMFLPNLYRTLAGPWYPITSAPGGPVVQAVVDQLLRFYPVGKASERCGSTVCHRCHLIFGRLWNHGNLSSATHRHLCNFFGGIHMDMLVHLVRTGNAQRDINNELQDLLTPENVERMRGIKMTFFSGGDNIVFTPKSTMMCYEFMRDRFGDGLYRRFVVNGYGHLDPWIGKNSHIDVYPIVQEHLDWFEERTKN
ncbi:hypothetical protein FB45DRAFT_825916 [Roridomyces roridus]|uniref:Glucose-methanol-choline oxidoreductase N-terminal domain-containing protein n=1 Tax=Roridomyces roridus TaxID=1738132 RepID=A0AAD7C7X6_9AGAR|nr:hypothetical protein FB45DRAFT_825916 [Roridomyces roridus]